MNYFSLFSVFLVSIAGGTFFSLYPVTLEKVKIISDIIFSIVASIIAILTFRAAKETFFQPIRSEVAKKQTELLSDLLLTLQQELNNKLDYIQLSHLNAKYWLLKYGFIFQNHEDVKKEVKDNVFSSQLFPDKTGKIKGMIVEAFEDIKTDSSNELKAMYEEAKKGNVNINEIVFTKKHMEIVIKLDRFANNPFIPTRISIQLKELIQQIQENRSVHLRTTICWTISKIFQRNSKTSITFDGVYNEFNHRRLHHNKVIESIKAEIRKYLQIDSVPWVK